MRLKKYFSLLTIIFSTSTWSLQQSTTLQAISFVNQTKRNSTYLEQLGNTLIDNAVKYDLRHSFDHKPAHIFVQMTATEKNNMNVIHGDIPAQDPRYISFFSASFLQRIIGVFNQSYNYLAEENLFKVIADAMIITIQEQDGNNAKQTQVVLDGMLARLDAISEKTSRMTSFTKIFREKRNHFAQADNHLKYVKCSYLYLNSAGFVPSPPPHSCQLNIDEFTPFPDSEYPAY